MNRLPERPNLDQLKKQAKELLLLYRRGDPGAIARFVASLPAVAAQSDLVIAKRDLRLHDAQSCLAREYGFASWLDLRRYVEARAAQGASTSEQVLHWLRLVYAGDTAGGLARAAPAVAARILQENPELIRANPYLACAVGDEAELRKLVSADPDWVNRPGGPLRLPPLVAVTHSSLVHIPDFRDGLHRSCRLILEAGADPNQSIGNRWPPASLERPSQHDPLSALYGAAGRNHDAELTKMLLDAGADPNDGESLYHALESRACTRLLLAAGAKITGSNVFYRAFDFGDLELVEMLLACGADPNEPPQGPATGEFGSPLLWAIKRRRSAAHVAALLRAGADPLAKSRAGISAYRLAQQFGLTEVAGLLRDVGAAEPLSLEEEFIASCARGDAAAARAMLGEHADLFGRLSPDQLQRLPDLAAEGETATVRLMVDLGWPISVRGGDWRATALNHAVFRGDVELTEFLLARGAQWTEEHGYGSNVCGTLSWASLNEPVEHGDWLGCARALVAHGMPRGDGSFNKDGAISIGGHGYRFSEEVSAFLQSDAEQ